MVKKQPSELVTWEELERMTPKVEIIEIKEETDNTPPPFMPTPVISPKKTSRTVNQLKN